MNRIASLACCCALSSIASAGLPLEYELIARANFSTSFNLPVGAQVVNAIPSINDAGQIAFTYADLNLDEVIWADGGDIAGPFFLTGDARISETGRVSWSVFMDGFLTDGVWTWTAGEGAARYTNGPSGASSWGTPQSNSANQLLWRSSVSGDDVVIIDDLDDELPGVPLAVADGSQYTFIGSSIDINESGQAAGKAFDTSGQEILVTFQQGQPDNIIADESGEWTGFLNSTDFNNNGVIAAQAFSPNGDAIVTFDQGGNETVIAREGVDVDTFEFFSPSINDAGQVAFRAIDNGLEGIWLGDGASLDPIALEGWQVMTDLGPAVFTDFSGNPDINNNGQIAINARASLLTGQDLGWGIYVITVVPAPSGLTCFALAGLVASRRRRS
ncbi:MAG: hypothetical protein Tsb0013_17790 [Phycisphaerales bacterium]